MTFRTSIPIALLLSLSGAVHAAPINLVNNGSFEQGALGIGSFQGWQTTLGDSSTFVDSSGQTGTHYGQATNGKWAAYFGSTASAGGSSVAQTLSTTAGQIYTLSFDLANDNSSLAASNQFVAYIGGVPVFTATNLPSQDFIHQQINFQANSAATPLRLFGYNDQSYAEIDNVSVTAATAMTPEPSSLLLVCTGFTACAAATWTLKRRNKTADL